MTASAEHALVFIWDPNPFNGNVSIWVEDFTRVVKQLTNKQPFLNKRVYFKDSVQ